MAKVFVTGTNRGLRLEFVNADGWEVLATTREPKNATPRLRQVSSARCGTLAMEILAKELEPRGISVVLFDPG